MDTQDFILPTLNHNQSGIKQKKYYNGNFYKVKNIISKDEDVSYMGNVVAIDKDNLIVKWNRFKKYKDWMLHEVRYQTAMGALGHGPMLRSKYQTTDNVFIIMDNLIVQGYTSLADILKDVSITNKTDIKKKVATNINNLHINDIVHGDIHEHNIFYNLKTNNVKFIDFSKTKFMPSYNDSVNNESYLFYRPGLQDEILNFLIDIDPIYNRCKKDEEDEDEYSSDYTVEYYTEDEE